MRNLSTKGTNKEIGMKTIKNKSNSQSTDLLQGEKKSNSIITKQECNKSSHINKEKTIKIGLSGSPE